MVSQGTITVRLVYTEIGIIRIGKETLVSIRIRAYDPSFTFIGSVRGKIHFIKLRGWFDV